jgi:hypothetical protein
MKSNKNVLHQMQINTQVTPSRELPKKFPAQDMIFAIIALIIVGGEFCYSQSNKTGQTLNTIIKQEAHITALEKKIAAAGDDFVSLTAEEYDLLLSQPIGPIDGFEPLTIVSGGIMVGIGFADGPKIYKTDIQTIFPNIPNIGEREVFVTFDFVKGTNGLDYLDRGSNTETEEKESTQLVLDIRTTGLKSYWFGSRYVNLRDPSDDLTIRALGALGGEVKLSTVSGKVVMYLPTNITGSVLNKGDIGVEKPFAGGVVTLKEITDGNITFQFTGDPEKIYAWIVYDEANKAIDKKEVHAVDGLYQIYAEHCNSLILYKAEIVRREYPFAFGNESQAASAAVSPAASVYLDKNDPMFMTISGRAVTDLKKKSDSASADNKFIAAKLKSLTKDEQNQLEAIFIKSISNYTARTHFDVGTFMLVFRALGKRDMKEMAEEYDIRVQYLGGNIYVAEFWEDGIAVNSEAHALASTNDPDDRAIVKETYADVRKSIETGKLERYTKVMALLYEQEKDGSITFHDPFQSVIDFISQ